MVAVKEPAEYPPPEILEHRDKRRQCCLAELLRAKESMFSITWPHRLTISDSVMLIYPGFTHYSEYNYQDKLAPNQWIIRVKITPQLLKIRLSLLFKTNSQFRRVTHKRMAKIDWPQTFQDQFSLVAGASHWIGVCLWKSRAGPGYNQPATFLLWHSRNNDWRRPKTTSAAFLVLPIPASPKWLFQVHVGRLYDFIASSRLEWNRLNLTTLDSAWLTNSHRGLTYVVQQKPEILSSI